MQTLERSTDVLFFGRVETYKGVEDLLAAWESATAIPPCAARLTIAGPVAPGVRLPPLPPGVELRDRRVFDEEAEALFRSASLLVLPYRDATQSALVAAAYAFGVPAIVTDAGALPEYIIPGETGWVVPAGDVAALAAALRRAFADLARLRKMGNAGRGMVRYAAARGTGDLGRAVASSWHDQCCVLKDTSRSGQIRIIYDCIKSYCRLCARS